MSDGSLLDKMANKFHRKWEDYRRILLRSKIVNNYHMILPTGEINKCIKICSYVFTIGEKFQDQRNFPKNVFIVLSDQRE